MIARGDSMLIVHKIEQTHFSASEAIIVDYILKQGQDIKHMSAHAIAKETFTSPPLLVRIAKKLGFSGWNDFKEAYVKELEYLFSQQDIDASIPFLISDDMMTIANNIGQLQIDTIKDTLSLLDHDHLQTALRVLRKTKIIDIYGVSTNILFAEEFKNKLSYIHYPVQVSRLPGDLKIQASMSDSTHCAILLSYSGETKYILDIADTLKKKHTPMIAITCIADNALSKIADVSLRMSSREMLHTKIGDFASTISIKCILDILYGCIFSFHYQENLDYKIELAKEIDDRHSGFSYIDEDE